jgi:hypothetical protein
MLQKFVIVQAFGGKPLKRIVMASAKKEVVVADPGLLDEIGTGLHQPVAAPLATVFNFDEDVFDELSQQWRSAKETHAETWARLGPFQPILYSAD